MHDRDCSTTSGKQTLLQQAEAGWTQYRLERADPGQAYPAGYSQEDRENMSQ